jgi:hypothetical protein
MPDIFKPPTHVAYAFRRMGKKPHQGKWLIVGTGRDNKDGTFDTFMDLTPIGGFNGHVRMILNGSPPPAAGHKPQRPDGTEDDSGGEDHSDV